MVAWWVGKYVVEDPVVEREMIQQKVGTASEKRKNAVKGIKTGIIKGELASKMYVLSIGSR